MRDDRQRLLDVLEAIERIEKYAFKGREAFEKDELIQNWILRNLLIIGEACRPKGRHRLKQWQCSPSSRKGDKTLWRMEAQRLG